MVFKYWWIWDVPCVPKWRCLQDPHKEALSPARGLLELPRWTPKPHCKAIAPPCGHGGGKPKGIPASLVAPLKTHQWSFYGTLELPWWWSCVFKGPCREPETSLRPPETFTGPQGNPVALMDVSWVHKGVLGGLLGDLGLRGLQGGFG